MKKQDKQLEKILFEVYDKGVKNEDCNLTECIEEIRRALHLYNLTGKSCQCGNKIFTHRHNNWIQCTACNKMQII